MPWKKGQPNGGGRQPMELSFRDMLSRASIQDDCRRVRLAAEMLLDQAAAGEAWAIRELADRLDGKAKQSVELEVRDKFAEELADAELLRIAAGGSTGATAKAGGAVEPDSVH